LIDDGQPLPFERGEHHAMPGIVAFQASFFLNQRAFNGTEFRIRHALSVQ